jgi:ankyrin repeat protein
MACQQGHADVAKALLEAGAEVDPKDAYGNKPLWRAVFAFRGDGELIRSLLDRGANPDSKNAAGKSPREMALTFDKPGLRELFSQ